jgi:EmrB/QacA subfamily drug resistance transporter
MEDTQTKKITLFIATLAAFIGPFDGSAVNVALPAMGKEFAMNAVSLGWIATAYLLSSAIFLLPFGRLADIFGRKKIYTTGLFVFTVASLTMTTVNTEIMLIILRVIQGIGAALIYGTGMALLTSVFPPQERGKALGIVVSATYIGLSAGPFLGGLLTHNFGWRSIFLVNVPIGFFVIILILLKLKGEWAEAKGEKMDLTGTILYCIGLTAVIYGFSSFSSLGTSLSLGIILAGIVSVSIFTWWENRSENPILEINLFRKNRTFGFSNLAALIHYCATFAITFFLSLYLQYIKQLDAQTAGAILIAQPIIMAVSSPFAGRLSDRIEPRIVASLGMGLTAIGLFLLAFLHTGTYISFIIAVLIVIGLGFGLFSSPNSNAVMSSVEKKYYGVASGTLATMRITGQMFSMGIAMLIFAIHMGNAQITPANFPAFLVSTKTAFILFGLFCTGGIFASLARGSLR